MGKGHPAIADLVKFIRARIREDETVAQQAIEGTPSEGHWCWLMHQPRPYRTYLADERGVCLLPARNDDVYPSAGVGRHIERHDPARVLVECATKRGIVRMAATQFDALANEGHTGLILALPYRAILISMAAPFSAHPDWNPDWENR